MIYANDAAARIVGLRLRRRDAARVRATIVLQRFQLWDETGQPAPARGAAGRPCAARAARQEAGSLPSRSTAASNAGCSLEAVPIIDERRPGPSRRQHHSRHDQSAPRRARERAPGRRGAGGAARARGSAGHRLARSAQSAGRRARLDRAAAQEQPAARQAGTGAPPGRGDPARRQPHEPADPRPARFREHPGGPPVGQHAARRTWPRW